MSQDEAQYDIFISYNSEDLALVEPIVSLLRQKQLRVFFAQLSSYLIGVRLEEELERVLRPCHALVRFLGPRGLGQGQDIETNRALSRQAEDPAFQFISVLLPGSVPSPRFLDGSIGIDLREEGHPSSGLATLLEMLDGSIDPEEPVDSITDPGETGSLSSPPEAALPDPASIVNRAAPQFDAFVCYNSADRSAVKSICQKLKERGVALFWDGDLLPGDLWQEELTQRILACRSFVIFYGKRFGPEQKEELRLALQERRRIFPVILRRGSIPKDEPLSARVNASHITNLAMPGALDRLAEAILRYRPTATVIEQGQILSESRPVKVLGDDVYPYRGLLPFGEADEPYFFGRDDIIAELLDALKTKLLCALVGSSGSGKSSVVRAGLIPRLRGGAGTQWEVVTVLPGSHPMDALASALLSFPRSPLPIEKLPRPARARAERLINGRESLGSIVEKIIKRQARAGTERLLIFVDQWEELYTLSDHSADKEQLDRFIEQILEGTSRSDSPLSVLLTCRDDFFGRLLRDKALAKKLGPPILVGRMKRASLRKAIEEPARRSLNVKVEPELVTALLDDVEKREGAGSLPLLEFALTELWKKRDKAQGLLLRQVYEKMGRLQGALEKRADEVVSSLPDPIVSRLFVKLVREEEDAPATRRRVPLREFDEQTLRVIDQLVEARLLVRRLDVTTGADTVEVAHEALLRNWGRLQNWLKVDRAFLLWRERLKTEQSAWDKNERGEGFLLSEGPLKEAEHWHEERDDDLLVDERLYIEKSLEKKARQEKREARRKAGWVAVVFLVVLLITFSWLYWRGRQESQSRTLASEALQWKDHGIDVSLLLSLEAGRLKDTVEARSSLLSLIQESAYLKSFLPSDAHKVYSAVFDPSGQWVASSGVGKIYLWQVRQTTELIKIIHQGDDADIISLAFSPDGRILASSKEKEDRIHFCLRDGQPLDSITVPGGAQGIQNLAFSPADGNLLAHSIEGKILLWDLREHRFRELAGHQGFVSRLAFSSDGSILASAGLDKQVLIWRMPAGELIGRLPPKPPLGQEGKLAVHQEEPFNGIAFRPNHPGEKHVLAVAGTGVQLWNVDTLLPEGQSLRDGSPPIVTVAFSADGETIASVGTDNKIRLWPYPPRADGRPYSSLVGHGGTVWSLAFGQGRELVSGGAGGEVILWDLALPPPVSRILPSNPEDRSFRSLTALDPEGKVLAVGQTEGAIALRDVTSGAPLGPLKRLHASPIRSLAIRQGGQLIASGDDEGHLFLWRDWTFLREVELQALSSQSHDSIRSLALTPDGRRGAVGTETGRIFLWDVDGKERATALREAGTPVSALAFDADGRRLVSAEELQLTLWDVTTQKKLGSKEEAHEETITSLAFRPHGGELASGSLDGKVRLWRVAEKLVPQEGALPVPLTSALAWSPDGAMLAAGGTDGTVALWDMEERRLLGSGFPGSGRIAGLAFRDNGHLISSSRMQVLEWDLRYGSWRSYACALVNWSLSRPEWAQYLAGKWTKYQPGRDYRRACEN